MANGNLDISFVGVGHGDCTVISFPDGGRAIIDAGISKAGTSGMTPAQRAAARAVASKSKMSAARKDRLDATVHAAMGGPGPVDVVVLTHPHSDHYNLLQRFVGGLPIGQLFYGGAWDAYSVTEFVRWLVLGSYRTGGMIAPALFTNPQGVTMNQPGVTEKLLYTGTAPGGQACELVALAGNYGYDPDNPPRKPDLNRLSIVTAVKLEGQIVALLLGDGTGPTETFLTTNYPGLTTRIVKVGHHGSETSSNLAFVNGLGATHAIVTAAYGDSRHHLPKTTRIDRWLNSGSLATLDPAAVDQYFAYTKSVERKGPPVTTNPPGATSLSLLEPDFQGSMRFRFDAAGTMTTAFVG